MASTIIRTMKKLFIFICLTSFLIACSSSGDKSGSSAKAEKTAAAKPVKKINGAKIYKTYCVTCHGIYGDMGGSGAFDLTTSKLTLEERIEVITKGRNLMTPFEGLLSEEKIKAVAEHIESLRTKE